MTVQIVGWALIHSLWQGALIAALLGITLTGLRKPPAAWRHLACLVALVALPLAPLVTSMRTAVPLPARAGTSATGGAPTGSFVQEPTEAASNQTITRDGGGRL